MLTSVAQPNKLSTILQNLTKVELNRCRKYICSPYFNRSQALVTLFDLLTDNLASEPEKEEIWNQINPGEQFDDVRYRKYLSDLLKLVEGFLAQEIYEENTLHQATYLLEAVWRRRLEKLYNGAVKSAKRLSDKQRYRPASFYYYQYQIEKNLYELTQFERIHKEKTNIEEIANNLDNFFLAEKLRYYCAVLSHQYELSHEYQILFIEEILSHLKITQSDQAPPVAIYHQIALSLLHIKEEAYYFQLKELLHKHSRTFPPDEAYSMYTFAINYCTRKINEGKRHFLREYFDLYNDLLHQEILIVDGEIAPAHFKNIVLAGLRLGEIDWTENFIHQYKSFLPELHRQNAVTFNLAQLYFYKKEYHQVLEQLRSVEYEDLSYNLNSKSFLLVTYYELDEIEALYSLLEAFRTYLQRQSTIPARRRQSYLNLIRFTRKLTRIMPGDTKAVEKLRAELEATRDVNSVSWLLEKIAELE